MTPGVPASQWDRSPRALVMVLVALVCLLIAAYQFGIPVLARAVAERLPDAVVTSVSDQVLAALEGQSEMLRPSALSAERQRRLEADFRRLIGPDGAGRYELRFRDGPALGANAMALPSGVIVVTDALVALAHDDREILGVLAHEAGHVHHQHGMRLVVQSSALTLLIGWFVGDVGSIAAMAPAALLRAKYSRDFEREADAHAADVLEASGIRPSVLAGILERIDASRRRQEDTDVAGGDGTAVHVRDDDPAPRTMMDYAATHPPTRERLEYLRGR